MELDLEALNRLNLQPKSILNIIFVGHVDSGKSTICGRILVDLNLVDLRTLEKYKQQSEASNRASWYLSWCMDLNPEEREKGKTTEIGTASFDLPHTKVNIIDSPGHKQFVNEMIEGASRADVGVLIVSARSGEFEAGFKGGQTKEHLLLLKAGNVEKLIVLINKMDECDWSIERYTEIHDAVNKHCRSLFKDIFFIPISGYNGDNIKTRKETVFYDGPSFLDYLDSLNFVRPEKKPSMTVLEKIKTSGSTAFYVKVDSGVFNKIDMYRILPINKEDRITSIMNEDEVELTEAIYGETYRIKLKEYPDELTVGSKIITTENSEYSVCSELYAQLGICEIRTALTIRYTCMLHLGVNSVGAKILEMFSMDKKKIKVGRKGEKIVVKLGLDFPIVVSCTETHKDRFSLRDESLTIAAGVIKKVINKGV